MVDELGSQPGTDRQVGTVGDGPVEPDEQTWILIRADTEPGEMTLNAVADKYRITPAMIRKRARANKWASPGPPASVERRLIIEQLYGVLERQIRHLRTVEMTPTGEKEVAVLHKLAMTLDKLAALDERNGGGKRTPPETKDIQDLRRKIAERIEELKLA